MACSHIAQTRIASGKLPTHKQNLSVSPSTTSQLQQIVITFSRFVTRSQILRNVLFFNQIMEILIQTSSWWAQKLLSSLTVAILLLLSQEGGSSVILQVSQAKLNSFFFLYFFCRTKFSQMHDNLGLCNGKKNLYDHHGVIGYPPSTSVSYVEGLSCQWFLHGKQGTLVSLSFTHKRLGFYCYI